MKLTETQMEEFKEIFDIFDMNGSGTIENDEIVSVMNILGENVQRHKVRQMIIEVDFDKNGVVDFDEFTCLMVKTLAQN